MKCPYCGHDGDKVVDSREIQANRVIRRRRECAACARRFTTYERIEDSPPMIIKKDGRRERFERQKLLGGLLKACEKRPVAASELEGIVSEVEILLLERPERELKSSEVGGHVMARLKDLDKVAYVRFASVYRRFEDVSEFLTELEGLLKKRD